jgi:hypothetical protein
MNKPEELEALAERLEKRAIRFEMAITGDEDHEKADLLLSSAVEDFRAAARYVKGFTALESAASAVPGWAWECFLQPGKLKLEYGHWAHHGYATPIEAIEAAEVPK